MSHLTCALKKLGVLPLAAVLITACGETSTLTQAVDPSTGLRQDRADSEPSSQLLVQGKPLFQEVDRYTTLIRNQDETDIYFPLTNSRRQLRQRFPMALVLTGALVDKQFYSVYAETIARYGFIVVVPNRIKAFPSLDFEGSFPDTNLIRDAFTLLKVEAVRPGSPVNGIVDTRILTLLGHSFGGAVGLSALAGECQFFLCEGTLDLPKAVAGGAFFGTNRTQFDGSVLETPNHDFPIAMVAGSLDGVSTPDETIETYNLIQNPPKALIVVEGANHFGITDINNPPGASPDPNSPELEQAIATETIARWSALFLRATVLNDGRATSYLNRTGDRLDQNVTVMTERF